MEHLNNTEIAEFVNISGFNSDTRELVKKVNHHIMSCPACAARVERAVRSAELSDAVSKADFSMKDARSSVYDISAEAVRFETETVFEDADVFGSR